MKFENFRVNSKIVLESNKTCISFRLTFLLSSLTIIIFKLTFFNMFLYCFFNLHALNPFSMTSFKTITTNITPVYFVNSSSFFAFIIQRIAGFINFIFTSLLVIIIVVVVRFLNLFVSHIVQFLFI